jgi:LacI family transcriptional regulator
LEILPLMPVTIRDVAKRLNLSITTVSRSLDGYDDVADKTRQRVIQAAREMGYVPDRMARQLRRKKTDSIGYILPGSNPRFADPFFSEFIAGLGDEATEHNFDLIISRAPPGASNEMQLYKRWVQGRRVDGIVLSRLRLDDWRVQYLQEMDFPFVGFGRSRTSREYPHIGVDGEKGVRQLVGHLIRKGNRRIAFISAPAMLTLQTDRFAGFRKGLQENGIDLDYDLVVEGDLTRQGGYDAAKVLLARSAPPTAIICSNDLTAIGAMRAASEAGFVVGKDLAIAGFDGIDDAEHTRPPLTTINQPVYEIACRLVQMLVNIISGASLEATRVILEPELILRASTEGKFSSAK